jgi:hypothetical protein
LLLELVFNRAPRGSLLRCYHPVVPWRAVDLEDYKAAAKLHLHAKARVS